MFYLVPPAWPKDDDDDGYLFYFVYLIYTFHTLSESSRLQKVHKESARDKHTLARPYRPMSKTDTIQRWSGLVRIWMCVDEVQRKEVAFCSVYK